MSLLVLTLLFFLSVLMKVPHEPFIPLTEDEEAEVYHAFSGRNRYFCMRLSTMLGAS